MSVPCHEGPPATRGHFCSEPAVAGTTVAGFIMGVRGEKGHTIILHSTFVILKADSFLAISRDQTTIIVLWFIVKQA